MGSVDPGQAGYGAGLFGFAVVLLRYLKKLSGTSVRIHDDECDKQLAEMRRELSTERESRIRLEEHVRWLEGPPSNRGVVPT